MKNEDNFDEIKRDLLAAHIRGLTAVGISLKGYAQSRVPTDLNNLKGSINYRTTNDAVIVGTNMKYAEAVEYGRSPGSFPPLEPLKGWAKRVLKDESAAYPVALKIKRKGSPAQPFMRPALYDNDDRLQKQYEDRIKEVL